MIPTRTLELTKQQFAKILPDTCNILSATNTPNDQGGFTQTWGTTTAGVKCRVDPAGGQEQIVADSLRPFSSWILTVKADTTITEQNRVEFDGNTYNVTGIINDGSSWHIVTKVKMEKVQ